MTPSAQWLTLFSSCLHQCGVPRSTMGPLRAVTDPVQGWGNLHNLIGGSQQYPASYRNSEIATRSRATKTPRQQQPSRILQVPKRTSSRALQEAKSNELLNLSLERILVENSNRCNLCNGKNTRSAQILHSQIPPKQQMLWGRREEEQGRTQQMNPQDLDAKASPH